jgi:hypothetical protein
MARISVKPFHGMPHEEREERTSPVFQEGKDPVLLQRLQGTKSFRAKLILRQLVEFLHSIYIQLPSPGALSLKLEEYHLLLLSSPAYAAQKKIRNLSFLGRSYRFLILGRSKGTLDVSDYPRFQSPGITVCGNNSCCCRFDGRPLVWRKNRPVGVSVIAVHGAKSVGTRKRDPRILQNWDGDNKVEGNGYKQNALYSFLKV